MTRSGPLLLLLPLAIAGAHAQAPVVPLRCDAPSTVHIPLEAVAAPLGLRGETRSQYLDRRYRAGGWRAAEPGWPSLTAPAAGAASLSIRLPARPGLRVERIDIVAEAQLDMVDADGRRSVRYGHREIGSFELVADADSELAVPLEVMRESGALLAIVTLRRAPGFETAEAQVGAVDIERPGCERRRYVPYRATAIRLNRRPAPPGHRPGD